MGNNYGLRDDYICDIYSDSIKVGYCKYYKPDISNESVYNQLPLPEGRGL